MAFVSQLIQSIIDIFKTMGKTLNDYSTLILVIITAIYAYFTYRMAKIMAKQVMADIQVSNVILGSNFLEDWFINRLKNEPGQIDKNSYFGFKLLFDIRNKKPGSGSIDKPVLILKFCNDDYKYQMPPKTKESWNEKMEETSVMTTYREVVNDLGGTIFLRGGDSQKIELEYALYDFDDDTLKHIKENINSLEYHLRFTDNSGKTYSIKIDDVRSKEEVKRR